MSVFDNSVKFKIEDEIETEFKRGVLIGIKKTRLFYVWRLSHTTDIIFHYFIKIKKQVLSGLCRTEYELQNSQKLYWHVKVIYGFKSCLLGDKADIYIWFTNSIVFNIQKTKAILEFVRSNYNKAVTDKRPMCSNDKRFTTN